MHYCIHKFLMCKHEKISEFLLCVRFIWPFTLLQWIGPTHFPERGPAFVNTALNKIQLAKCCTLDKSLHVIVR